MIVSPQTKDDNLVLAQWACGILGDDLEAFGFNRSGDPLFQTLGFTDNKKNLLCVVIAYHYAKPNVFMAFASRSPRWATKGNIRALGDWAFNELGCSRITATVNKTNKRARKFDEGVGFTYEGNMRGASEEGDIIIYALHKKDHEAWLRKAFKDGKAKSSGS